MVTTDKNYAHYEANCHHCKKPVQFATGLPGGSPIFFLCECYFRNNILLPDDVKGHRLPTETQTFRMRLLSIFGDIKRSMTVRQVFYQAVSKGLIPKDDSGYRRVQSQLLLMRREGVLPYSFIADNSRRWMKPETHNDLEDALQDQLRTFRVDMWKNLNEHIEIWLEKDALSGIFYEVTSTYDVPLFVARGFSSESFIYRAAEHIKEIGKPTTIYFFSDYDPSGIQLAETVEKLLPRFDVDMTFIRSGLNREQIDHFDLPTRPTKKSTHKKDFNDESTDLDALHPDDLIQLITDVIEKHIPEDELRKIQIEEDVHRATLDGIIKKMKV